ncbi:MAG: FAD-binding oxidoreductase [Chloroflexi bacterium]|nr:FAD-binding oxidoreductase [Chloroflexota bacterium]
MAGSEVLIIGGGITGASTAWHLAQQGHGVTLLERGDVASEASGVNAGSIGALGWGALPDLQAYLTMGSLEIFKSLQLDQGYDIEFRASGSLQAIHTEAQYEYARDRVLTLRSQGYSVELLTTREVLSMEPEANPRLLGFTYFPLRSQADPVKATRALASAASRHGADVITGREVTAVHVLGDSTFRVETDDGDIRSQVLVLAVGAWSGPLGKMLGLNIPIVPVRGQMWATEALPPKVFHTITSTESAYDWSLEPNGSGDAPPELTHRGKTRITRHLYGRQTRSGQIIFGGDRQQVGYDNAPDATGIEVNRGHAAEVLPFLNDVPVQRTWSGLMPFSMDGKPIIGKIPQVENLYIVSGLASSGFGRGPMAGKLVADYIHGGHRPQVLAECDPARCVTASGCPESR